MTYLHIILYILYTSKMQPIMTFESMRNNIRLKLWRSKVLWLVTCEPMNHKIANNICGDYGLLYFIIFIEIILKDYHFNMIILIVLRGVAGSRCRAAINGNLIVRCSSPKMWGNVNWNQRHLARVKAYECSQCKYLYCGKLFDEAQESLS